MKKIILISLLSVLSLFAFDFDKKVKKEDGGFWGAHYNIPKYMGVAVLGASLYEGTSSRFGKTSWQALDAALVSQVFTEGMKKATGRKRPRNAEGPSDWNEGGESFPSGHVSGVTAMVTPYILEYGDEQPWVHALWFFPIHQMVGRVKAQAHWQSDVTVGALVGFASGYFAHSLETPLLLSLTEDGAFVGIKYKF